MCFPKINLVYVLHMTGVDTDDEMEQLDDRVRCDKKRRNGTRQVSIVSNTFKHF